MTTRKKLIEVALPLEAINEASAREKSIRHGHPSTLHLWWARRPLAACRAVIFASLVDDPDDPAAPPDFVAACCKLPKGKNAIANDTPRQRLFDFIELLVQWESTTDEKVLQTARELIRLATGGNPPPLLDPFAGGGSIPLEAQRLGLEAHASDLNPVAVMINKALIEIPPKFANQPPVNPRDRQGTAGTGGWKGAAGLAADVRYYGEWMRDRAWERIGHLYPRVKLTSEYGGGEATIIAWLWVQTVRCPNPACGAQMPLARSFQLATKKGKEAWIKPEVDYSVKPPQINFVVNSGNGTPPKSPKIGRGAKFYCLACGQVASEESIRAQFLAKHNDSQLMAIVAEGERGRIYLPPNDEQQKFAKTISPDWMPEEEMNQDTPTLVSGRGYGIKYWSEIFTSRQLVTLTTFNDLISEVWGQVYQAAKNSGLPATGNISSSEYSNAIITYLAFALDRLANYLTKICTWHSGIKYETITSTFGRQALPMTWDFAEGNPFSDSSGNFLLQISGITNNLENLFVNPSSRGEAVLSDAASFKLDLTPMICTDPPYYDNISYAELSDFFYIWLRRSLRRSYPDLFNTILVPKSQELVAVSHRFNGVREKARQFFEEGLEKTFRHIRNCADVDYPLTVFYAFKQAESEVDDVGQPGEYVASTGWETMLEGLVRTGFVITGTWPIRTELVTNLKKDISALASSIILVCRPRPNSAPITSRQEFVKTLRRELPEALRKLQSGNIAPVDLAQASIGPGMAVYSRYSKVLEPDGQRLSVRTALQLINYELDTYLAEQEGDMDQDSRFAIAWFEQFGFKAGPFGQADVLARAKNTSVDGLANAGLLESGAGKVRLYHWSELEPGWDPATDRRLTTWEATHHLIERLNTYGEEGAARLLAKLSPDMAAEARQLAYRLYSICERKGWTDHARDYNALVISWGASQEQAVQFREQYQQGRLFG
ncbi:MAG: hypothetical protein BroJett011_33970 [Chloroflexota bacterium]|nr:MAG: hypothetical protein BroJett011_33970 [Chloroflexota bacterium]